MPSNVPSGLIHGNSRHLAHFLKPFSSAAQPALRTTITSPPYGELKDYGVEEQIGRGQDHDSYLDDLQDIFGTLYRHTRLDGSLWLNVANFTARPSRRDAKPGRLVPLAWELSARAQAEGWLVRNLFVWKRDRSRPFTGGKQLRHVTEDIILLVKSFEHGPAPDIDPIWPMAIALRPTPKEGATHPCPFPDELVERCIELSSDQGDVVFDPFGGIGTTPRVANRLQRHGLALEINRDFVKTYAQPMPSAGLEA